MADLRRLGAGWPQDDEFESPQSGWVPPVGDRVRVRRDLESCCPEGAHAADEPGHVGTVLSARRAGTGSLHAFLVQFDDPPPVIKLPDHTVPMPARHYAAVELEPTD